MPQRCPNGSRRNKKTGNCDKKNGASPARARTPSPPKNNRGKTTGNKQKRCPNGTRRNKKTGNCEGTHKSPSPSPDKHSSPKNKYSSPKSRHHTVRRSPEYKKHRNIKDKYNHNMSAVSSRSESHSSILSQKNKSSRDYDDVFFMHDDADAAADEKKHSKSKSSSMPGLIPDSRYNSPQKSSSSMPGLIPDSRYNSPQKSSSAAFHTAKSSKSSNSANYHTPKSSNSANFHTPKSSNSANFHTPKSSNSANFHTPKSSNSANFHTPKSSNSANFHSPQARQQKPRNKKKILKKDLYDFKPEF